MFTADGGETYHDSTELHRRFVHEPNKPMIERTGAAKVMGCSEKVKVLNPRK